MTDPVPTVVPPSPPSDPGLDGRKEACKTYIEQTKLLVTLASALIFAPAAIIGLLKDHPHVDRWLGWQLIGAEVAFVVSVLFGYIALASVTGSQDAGSFDVYRTATRLSSLAQFAFYLLGMALFVWLTVRFFGL
jgi:hypothetical protein